MRRIGEAAGRGTTRAAIGVTGATGASVMAVTVVPVPSAGPLPGVRAERWAGLVARSREAPPAGADLARVAELGGAVSCARGRQWPGQLDDLGDAADRSVGAGRAQPADVGAAALGGRGEPRACTDYRVPGSGRASGPGSRATMQVVVSGGAYGVDAAAHRGALGGDEVRPWRSSPAGSTASIRAVTPS